MTPAFDHHTSGQLVDDVAIKVIRSADPAELAGLYYDAGWIRDLSEKHHGFLKQVVRDSAVFAAAFHEEKLIGMGRALSDLASDAYIQDLAVLKEYRGKGIGTAIIQKIIRELKQKGVDWIGLIAEPETCAFYEKAGFKPMKGYLPMKLDIP